MIKEINIFIEK
jgi:hypothetical protein